MITEDGTTSTWSIPSDTPNPTKPWDAQDDPAQPATVYNNVPVVVLPRNRVLFESLRRTQPEINIPMGTYAIYLPGDCGFVPTLNSECTWEGQHLVPIWMDTYAPDGAPILYEITARQQI